MSLPGAGGSFLETLFGSWIPPSGNPPWVLMLKTAQGSRICLVVLMSLRDSRRGTPDAENSTGPSQNYKLISLRDSRQGTPDAENSTGPSRNSKLISLRDSRRGTPDAERIARPPPSTSRHRVFYFYKKQDAVIFFCFPFWSRGRCPILYRSSNAIFL